jgi:hypothetical protein
MSKNAKAVREAIEARRIKELEEAELEKAEVVEEEQIDCYSSDYGEEEDRPEEEEKESSNYSECEEESK